MGVDGWRYGWMDRKRMKGQDGIHYHAVSSQYAGSLSGAEAGACPESVEHTETVSETNVKGVHVTGH